MASRNVESRLARACGVLLMSAARAASGTQTDGVPDTMSGALEPSWRDTDDAHRDVVDPDDPPDERGVATELFPEQVRDHRHELGARRVGRTSGRQSRDQSPVGLEASRRSSA